MSAPQTVTPVVGIASSNGILFALRADGAVFVLRRRGDLLPNGNTVLDPYWDTAPAVPGTVAAVEQEG